MLGFQYFYASVFLNIFDFIQPTKLLTKCELPLCGNGVIAFDSVFSTSISIRFICVQQEILFVQLVQENNHTAAIRLVRFSLQKLTHQDFVFGYEFSIVLHIQYIIVFGCQTFRFIGNLGLFGEHKKACETYNGLPRILIIGECHLWMDIQAFKDCSE